MSYKTDYARVHGHGAAGKAGGAHEHAHHHLSSSDFDEGA